MIFFVRSCLASYDSRIHKYFQCLQKAGLTYKFVGWRRGDDNYVPHDHEIIYLKNGQLGAGWRNLFSLIKWNFFLLSTLISHRRQIGIVHAVDLDSTFICYVFCLIFRKKIIFDVYDKYTAVRNITGIAGRVIDRVELSIAKNADLTILAGPTRYKQLGLNKLPSNFIVLENVPAAQLSKDVMPQSFDRVRLGYFGVLEPHHRGLEDMLNVVALNPDVEFHLAGYGGLLDEVKRYEKSYPNIYYHGILNSHDGLKLMSGMHVIVGMYYLSVPNHYYASPNKYYEHLMLGRGLLTTHGTAPGDGVFENATGWAINEGQEAISAWLKQLDSDKIISAGETAYAVWIEQYSDYFQKHYNDMYLTKVKSMLA